MLRTFFLFAACSFRNWLRVKTRRLREPRYLVGALAGLAWLGMVLRGQLAGGSGRQHTGAILPELIRNQEATQFYVALALLAWSLVIGFRPGRRSPIVFSPAEVQLLFPAPLSRRQLLHYKLLRSLGALLFGTLFMTVLWRPATFVQGWTFYAGLWLLLIASRLYSMGAGLANLSLASHGLAGLRRRWGFVTLVVGALAVLAVVAIADWPNLAPAIAEGRHWEELRRIWSVGAARVVLWPFMAVARPALAGSAPAFLAALPAALAVVLVGYLWVIRSDAAFEEAAAAQAEKRSRSPQAHAAPAGGAARPVPFPLATRGGPEGAILWKNLVSMVRALSPKVLLLPLLFLAPMVLGMTVGRHHGKTSAGSIAFVLSLTCGVMALLVGPLSLRLDLRRDLDKLAIIKSWPVSGAAIVRGELLAPTIVLSLFVWVCVVVAALALGAAPPRAGSFAALAAHRGAYAAAALLATPGAVLALLLGPNTLALVFPAWVAPAREGQGQPMMGPHLVVMIGGLIGAAVFLVPALAGAALVMAVLRAVTGAPAVVVPAGVLSVLVATELLLASRWLGRVLERTDVTAVG